MCHSRLLNLLILLESLGSNPTPSYSSLYRESASQGRCVHFLCASRLDAVLTRKASETRVRARILPTTEECSSDHCKNPCRSSQGCSPFTFPTGPLVWKELG
jgi:hypothetical protein